MTYTAPVLQDGSKEASVRVVALSSLAAAFPMLFVRCDYCDYRILCDVMKSVSFFRGNNEHGQTQKQ